MIHRPRLELLIATRNLGKLREIGESLRDLPLTLRYLQEFPDISPVDAGVAVMAQRLGDEVRSPGHRQGHEDQRTHILHAPERRFAPWDRRGVELVCRKRTRVTGVFWGPNPPDEGAER